jgi:hypothetical protein
MPLNLLKKYNQLLELESLRDSQRKESLLGIFNRDIVSNASFKFQGRQINPTPHDGVIEMDTLFTHLTTEIVDPITRKREFEIHRSKRLHWVKHHVDEKKTERMLVFSVKESDGFRTYIYDQDESYVIVLEPLRKKREYYLLTAFWVRGKDAKRNKFLKKHKRRLPEVL